MPTTPPQPQGGNEGGFTAGRATRLRPAPAPAVQPKPPPAPAVVDCLSGAVQSPPKLATIHRNLRPADIVAAVVHEVGVDMNAFYGKSRDRKLLWARELAAYLCRHLTTLSFFQIAKAFGRHNHSGVRNYYCRFVERGDYWAASAICARLAPQRREEMRQFERFRATEKG